MQLAGPHASCCLPHKLPGGKSARPRSSPILPLPPQVHTVITSLTAHIPQLSVVLANGSTPPAAEAALLSGHVATSPLVALLPAVTRLAAPPQQAAAAGADIAVMTPGRLVHHLEALGPLWRDSLEIVVRLDVLPGSHARPRPAPSSRRLSVPHPTPS